MFYHLLLSFPFAVVTMPSTQYRLALGNSSVGSLTESNSMVTGLALGHTQIMLQDRSILFQSLRIRLQA